MHLPSRWYIGRPALLFGGEVGDGLTAYLAEHVAHKERRPEQVRVELLARCRMESIEPPAPGRCDRIVAAALRAAEESLTALISSRLTAESVERIWLWRPAPPKTTTDSQAAARRVRTRRRCWRRSRKRRAT
ncbi:hypothetical protein [Streptomyces avermitilis]|uniref:hypothetical protein n=1 Tax=Streptomyces avermitilis TaxID=33903 RepID=UPI0033A6FB93